MLSSLLRLWLDKIAIFLLLFVFTQSALIASNVVFKSLNKYSTRNQEIVIINWCCLFRIWTIVFSFLSVYLIVYCSLNRGNKIYSILLYSWKISFKLSVIMPLTHDLLKKINFWCFPIEIYFESLYSIFWRKKIFTF